MISLLDVNVLIALLDANHVFHDLAHQVFEEVKDDGWATCPVTVNGCVRILSQPNYPSFRATPQEVIARLEEITRIRGHVTWPASVSLLDASLFDRRRLTTPRSLTDIYLLGLAVQNRGRLVTFDRTIPRSAVLGVQPGYLLVLGV